MDPQVSVCGRVIPRGGLSVAVVFAALVLFAQPAKAQSDEMPQTPAEYEEYALEQNRALRAHYKRWQASHREADADEAGWPQPSLNYTFMSDSMGGAEPAPRHQASVSQQIPWPGVLDKSAEPARWRAEAHRGRFEEEALEVLFEVRQALIEIARYEALQELVEEQREVYREAQSVIEQIMEVEDVDYGDLLRLQVAQEQLSDRLDTLESRRDQQVAELRQVLDLGPNVPLEFDFEEGSDPLDVPEERPPFAILIKHAAHHPHIATARAEMAAARAQGEYARARRLPWPTLSLGLENMPSMRADEDRTTALMAGVSIPLPIFGSQYELEAERFTRESEAIHEDHFSMHRHLTSQIEASFERLDEQLTRLERYETEMLPLAADATEQMLYQIEVGEREVTDYLLSFEQELDLETSVVDFKAAIATERARLEQLTGGRFSAYPDRPSPTIQLRDLHEGEGQ